MRHFILLLTFITPVFNLNAQELRYITGAKIENYDNIYFRLFRQDEHALYAYSYVKPDFYIDIFDKEKLQAAAHIKIPFPSKDSISFSVEDLFILQDRYLAFYSYFDKSEKSEKLEMIAFDKKGSRIGEPKLIDNSEGKNERRAGAFAVFNRPAEHKFLSYGFKKIKRSNYINIDHFDYAGNKLKSQDFVVNNSWGVVLATFNDDSYIRLIRGSAGKWNLQWEVNIYSPASSEARVIRLRKPEAATLFVSDMFRSYIDDNDMLHLLSPYITSALSEKAVGLYHAKIDLKTQTLIKEAVIPFKTGTALNADDADFNLSSGVLTHLIATKNGLRAIFESRLMTSTYGVPTQYRIGNVIAFDLDSNDVAQDIKVLRKKQNTSPAKMNYSSFTTLNHNDTTYCVYNELPENLQRSDSRLKNVNGNRIDETVVVYANLSSDPVKSNILIDKAGKSGTDAVMPGTSIKDTFKKGTLYILRRINNEVYLTKIFRDPL
ncbi:MAG: hypothetical protein J7599_09420 [Niabella sp.]|nr:hypothetical protein [Niabella sp.]